MKIYRVRLKGTGLYYQPNSGRFSGSRTNLSVRGKLYLKKPNVDCRSRVFISQSLHKKYPEIQVEMVSYYKNQPVVVDGELELVTYECVEVTE